MKKNVSIFLLVVTALFFLQCGSKKSEDGDVKESITKNEKAEVTRATPELKGFENDFIKIGLMKGWEAFDDNIESGLMRIRTIGDINGAGPTIYFVFHGDVVGQSPCTINPKEAVKKFKEEYKGTDVEAVTYNKVTFFKTVFDYQGKQTMMQTKILGACIHIKLAGKDAVNNPDINHMLNSLSFKMSIPEDEVTAE